jgi:site-specific DNA recombinase
MFRCAIVAAVSTVGQATEEKASLPQQLAQAEQVCAARGWSVVERIEIPGHSRNYTWLHEIIRDCPPYSRLIELVEAGAVDLVVCRDYDRLWRTDALRAQVTALCRAHRVQVFAVNQPVEPVSPELLESTDTARLSEVLFGFISEQENRTRARRFRVGMAGKVAQGRHAQAVAPYGYRRRAGEALMELNPEEAVWVRWIFERRAEGVGGHAIALQLETLGAPAPGGKHWWYVAVRRITSNPVYRGAVTWGAFTNEKGQHTAIVDDDLWRRVQDMNANRAGRGGQYPTRPLSGMCRCGLCGQSLTYTTTAGKYTYLRCRPVRGKVCTFGAVPAPDVHRLVLAQVREAIADPEAWLHYQQQERGNGHIAAQIAMLDDALADVDARWQRWNSLYEAGGITGEEMLLHRQELRGRADALSHEREALRAQVTNLAERADALAGLRGVLDTLERMNDDDMHGLYLLLVRHVTVYRQPLAVALAWR